MRPWWQSAPEILASELAAFEGRGIEYEIDEDAQSQGVLIVHIRYPFDDEIVELTAIYANHHPYFPPQVYAPNARFALHQNPANHHLCLLGDRTQEWKPSKTLLDHIDEKYPMLVNDNKNPDTTGEPQAAPYSGFFRYNGAPSSITVDGSWRFSGAHGEATVHGRIFRAVDGRHLIQGIITRLKLGAAQSEMKWTNGLPAYHNLKFTVPIIQTGTPEFIDNPKEHLNRIAALHPKARTRRWLKSADKSLPPMAILGITYEEDAGQNTKTQGWQFFFITKDGDGETVRRVRALRGGPQDLGARVPAVQTLRSKTILVAGIGAVGGPVACELARNGTRLLRILDDDIVEPGPTVRWPLGMRAYGFAKVQGLQEYLAAEYPHCLVEPVLAKIGAAPAIDDDLSAQPSNLDKTEAALATIDLIVDGSAEVSVQHFLSSYARQHALPYIYASTTPGAKGGLVGRIMPNDSLGCWFCQQAALHGETPTVSPPPAQDDSDVMPAGCNHPTFSGAGYDVQEISLQAIRMAVQSFDPSARSAFARLAFEGPLALPNWTAHDIPKQPECPHCHT